MATHPAELLRDVALPSEARFRLKQIDDGTVYLISWNVARKRLRGRLEQ